MCIKLYTGAMLDKIEIEVEALTYTEHYKSNYILILKEKYGKRKLAITIGPSEAQAIALKLENIVLERPMTHDLILNILNKIGVEIIEVIINKIEEEVYFSEIIINYQGKILHIDSRPSDAIALALRVNCPIFTTKEIMDSHGINLEELMKKEEEISEEEEPIENEEHEDYLKSLTLDDLEKLMQDAIAKENYELASKIRDEIKRRKGLL